MKKRRVDSKMEQQILIALITSKEYLAQVSPIIDLDLLESGPFRQVAQWCLNYYNKYQKAPNAHIESIYHAWVEEGDRDESQVEAIHDFLGALDGQYDALGDINVPYVIDATASLLTARKLAKLKDNLEYHLSEGEVKKAEEDILNHKSVEIGHGVGIDILNDKSAWERAFQEKGKPLITFPGDAGIFLNDAMTRDALIGIQGIEKRGKTWWCIEFAMRALKNRKRVALFEVGDLSENQIVQRMASRFSGTPFKVRDYDISTTIPQVIERPKEKDGLATLSKFELKRFKIEASIGASFKGIQRLMGRRRKNAAVLPPHFMVSIHSNSSINIREISGIIEQWNIEKGFIPDVIIIDYPDILAPEDTSKNSRDQVNDTWKALRKLSQDRHCLVIAPTQADAGAYDIKTQSMKNFSEDKRKLAHVTGMLGLNQLEEEKKQSIMRLNWIALRESDFVSYRCLYVGQCIPIGKALCCSTL